MYPGLKLNYNELASGFHLVARGDESNFMNTCLHKEPRFNQDYAFSHCNTAIAWKCRFLKDYHLYACSMLPNLPLLVKYFPGLKKTPLGQINIEDNGIDIRTHTNEEIEEFLKHSIPACQFCNVDHAKYFRPWGETNYDLSEWVEE